MSGTEGATPNVAAGCGAGTHPVEISPTEMRVWRTFLRVHAAVTWRLETQLLDEQDLPLASYDVLVQLAEAPDRRLRMNDLAGRVLLSRSGLTRMVDRLQREGLVERTTPPDDQRGMYAVLTRQGYERLRAATPTHLRGVREQVLDKLDGDELRQLGALLGKLL